jgi:hypothetical protein
MIDGGDPLVVLPTRPSTRRSGTATDRHPDPSGPGSTRTIGAHGWSFPVKQRSEVSWAALVLIFVGLFGVAVALTALWSELPAPAAGGTCGPSRGSETAIEALVDPGSIGAGAEPPATRAAARAQWNQFVDECQSATNDRALLAFPVFVVSAGLTVAGFVLLRRRGNRSTTGAPTQDQRWSPPPDTLFAMSSPLVAPPPSATARSVYDRTGPASGSPVPPPPPPPPTRPPPPPPPV